MEKIKILFNILLFIFSYRIIIQAQTLNSELFLVSKWGATSGGNFWPILNDSSTNDGNASMGDTDGFGNGWATIRGGFDYDIEAASDSAIIIKGKLEFVGTGLTLNSIRYALIYQDSAALQNQYTDSAMWISNKGHYGYGFMPISGPMTHDQPPHGTVWTIIDGKYWNSTAAHNGYAISDILPSPPGISIMEGIYDWAISVQPFGDGTNEVRWYLIEENKNYWFGGTAIDTGQVTAKFNGICFGMETEYDTILKQFNLTEVRVEKGDPIAVPPSPWKHHYIDKWGLTPQGKAWPILNDSLTIRGNAGIGGPNPIPGWATIRGGFNETLQITKDKAVVVKGKIQFIGGGGGDTDFPLRYALTYNENDTLMYQYTDSAYWTDLKSWGCGFYPRTGKGRMPSGAGGIGTVWLIFNANWLSTNSGSGLGAIAEINQAPHYAELIEGTYEFAVSVHQVNDSINEIRWYLVEEYNRYWFGGIVFGPAIKDKFNAINFGLRTGGFTQFNIIDAEVDLGEPIDVPDAPWESYYIHQWGFFGGKIGGWAMSNNDVAGNVTISGNAPNTDWTAVRGEFFTIETAQNMPLKITGNLEFLGDGFDVSGSFRVGLFYTRVAGWLEIDSTDSNSLYWTGTDNYASGYLFIPQSGNNGPVAWNGSSGTWGAVSDTIWYIPSGYVIGRSVPYPAAGGEGEYEFEMSVSPQNDGTSLVKFNMKKENFNWIVSAIDYHNPLVTNKFNSIAFALNAGNNITAINITDVQIDTGTITKVEKINVPPNQYALSQNYPNPFNPATNFEFRITDFGFVVLKVFDILGKEVATLVNEEKPAGVYKIKFDASELASGVYLYQLRANNFIDTKKFVLLK